MEHMTKLTTRFCETDALGHINNVSYFIYLEQARVKFLQDIGLQMKASDRHFIIASIGCEFKRQAYFDQRLTVRTAVSHIGNSSVQFIQRVTDEDTGEEIARGLSTIVHFNFKTQKSERIPDEMRKQFQRYVDTKVGQTN